MAESEKIEVDKLQLEKLLYQNEEHKAEAEKLRNIIMEVLKILNLADEKGPKLEYFSPDEDGETDSFFPPIIKGLGTVLTKMTGSSAPIIGKKYKKELEEMFAFLKDIGPLVDKYAKNGRRK